MDEENIFLQAVERKSFPERAQFLKDACGGDARLRAEVESLLEHHDAAEGFLEMPAAELQQTFAAGQSRTVDCRTGDAALEMLAPCDKAGALGQLGPYEVLEILGHGGMGYVFRAHDPKLNRDVAIKVMAIGLHHPDTARRFVREAQTAARVKHENVVTIHAIHDEGPLPYIVMELIEGISLQQKLDADGMLELGQAVRIGSQLAAGLDAAHRRGVVHRDIKPANILFETSTQRVKITDFGLARAVDDAHFTKEGQIAGTPQFMSPEQAQGRTAGIRSDLFSLGSVLYAICTGRAPFPAETAVATLRAICDREPAPIREVNKDIPAWLEAIIRRLLEKDPDKRPASAREVADALAQGLNVQQTSSNLRQPPTAAPRAARWIEWALAGAASLLLAGVIIVVTSRKGRLTRIEVPEGATAKVTADGEVQIHLAEDRPEAPALSSIQRSPPLNAVMARLMQLNPGFDGQAAPTFSDDRVIELRLNSDHLKDISPLRELTALRRLVCMGSALGSSPLADLSPLRGMSLQSLDCPNTQVADLAPLKGMPLERLNLANTKVGDLSPLEAMRLKELYVQGTQVADLSPLRRMPLVHLNLSATNVTSLAPLEGLGLVSFLCDATHIADFSPLGEMPLKCLNWRGYDQSDKRLQDVVRSIQTLEVIDSLPAAEFWRALDAKAMD